ncbi:substance-P receptor-like [Stylophora pistillata]|uniref:substance-P receptor-like n=1 Tax=Stylophora pistillata TaxID=50429 RepID=UPI000C03D1E6|nr:substance-P receptor-like [Stylophora pistillata]
MENSTNSSLTESSQGDSFELRLTKATICMFVLVASLIENSLVLVILKKNYRSRVRTANGFFIANMSVADILFALQNTPHAYNNYLLKERWNLQGWIGIALCKIDMFFSFITMVTANLTILAIAVDRMFAVYVPLKKIITRRICFIIILLTWLIPAIFASPMLYYGDLVIRGGVTSCNLKDRMVLKTWYMVLAGILATTLVTILALYTAIGFKLSGRKFPGNASQRNRERRLKRNRDIFKMLITLIVVFYICSLPILSLHVSFLLDFYELFRINHIRFTALFLYFSNGAINPIIYLIFNESFRDGIKAALLQCKCSRGFVYSVETEAAARKRSTDDGNDGLRSSTQL